MKQSEYFSINDNEIASLADSLAMTEDRNENKKTLQTR